MQKKFESSPIDHRIFVQRLHTFIGLSDSTLDCFRPYLSDLFPPGMLTLNQPLLVMAFLGVQYSVHLAFVFVSYRLFRLGLSFCFYVDNTQTFISYFLPFTPHDDTVVGA